MPGQRIGGIGGEHAGHQHSQPDPGPAVPARIRCQLADVDLGPT
jgi:hypothetical protein